MSEIRFTKAGQHFRFFSKRDGENAQVLIMDYADKHNLEIVSLTPYTFSGHNTLFIVAMFKRMEMLECADCGEPTSGDYLCGSCRALTDVGQS